MARKPKSSGPISRTVSTSVHIGRLVPGKPDARGHIRAIGVQPIAGSGALIAELMDRVRERAAFATRLEDWADVEIAECTSALEAAGFKFDGGDVEGPDLVPGSQDDQAFHALAFLKKVKLTFPEWTEVQRLAIGLAMRAGALLERRALMPVEPLAVRTMETREKLRSSTDSWNARETKRKEVNREICRHEAALIWADNPSATVDFVSRDIEDRADELGLRGQSITDPATDEVRVKPVKHHTIDDYIRDLRPPKKSRKAG